MNNNLAFPTAGWTSNGWSAPADAANQYSRKKGLLVPFIVPDCCVWELHKGTATATATPKVTDDTNS